MAPADLVFYAPSCSFIVVAFFDVLLIIAPSSRLDSYVTPLFI